MFEPTLSDARFEALGAQGFTGATSDRLLQWLQANGATASAIPDAWMEMLAANGFPYGQRNDSWYAFLGSLGQEGNMNDREMGFWGSGGTISPDGVRITQQPVSWSGLENQTATFTVVATSGDGSPLVYEWQELVGSSYIPTVDAGNVSGSATATLTVAPAALEDNGNRYRVKVCNDVNCIFSVQVRLTITGAKFFIIDEDGNRQVTETTLANIMDERSI